MTDQLHDEAPEETPGLPRTWWHAFGRVREDFGGVWQLTVISPSPTPPEEVALMGNLSWGPYLTSWEHEPSHAEKEAVTPEEYRDEVQS